MQLFVLRRWAAVAVFCVSSNFVSLCDAAAKISVQQRTVQRIARGAHEQVVVAVKRYDMVSFGPENCISTWRNGAGHCEVKTECKDTNIDDYQVKLICVDNGGQKVRHIFARGSFDSEEQFDTLIECKRCLADKSMTPISGELVSQEPQPEKSDDFGKPPWMTGKKGWTDKEAKEAAPKAPQSGLKTVQPDWIKSAEPEPAKSDDFGKPPWMTGKKGWVEEEAKQAPPKKAPESGLKNTKPDWMESADSAGVGLGTPLGNLKGEVKELEAFMKKTSAQVEKLNQKVYSSDFQPQPSVNEAGIRAAEAALKASSLVNHATTHHEQRPTPRQEAQANLFRREHQRILAAGAELDKDFKKERRRAILNAPPSMSAAEKVAEERDKQDREDDPRSLSPLPHSSAPVALSKVFLRKNHKQDDDIEDAKDAEEDNEDDDTEDGVEMEETSDSE
jgi:hypothetical protein